MLGQYRVRYVGGVVAGLLLAVSIALCVRADDAPSQNAANEFQKLPSGIDFSDHFKDTLGDDKKTDNSTQKDKNKNGQSQPVPVGTFCDSRNLDVRGAKTFTPEEIRQALFRNQTVRFAETPSADLDAYIRTLKRAVEAGYGQAGFPDTKVEVKPTVDLQSGKRGLRIDVDEGKRFTAGGIEIRHAKTISAERLRTRLQSAHYPPTATLKSYLTKNGETTEQWVDSNGKDVEKSPALWNPGKPVAFAGWNDTTSDRYGDMLPRYPAPAIVEDIKNAFEEQGCFIAEYAPELVLDREHLTATLVIDILDEGPLAEVGEIEVIGNKLNSKDEVADFLGLKPGKKFAREDLLRANKALWDTGRFLKAKVTPMKPSSAGDKLLVQIELVEDPHAPPLAKPLSAEEQIMLKLGAWLSNQHNWDGDLVVHAEMAPEGQSLVVDLVQSPTDGAAAHVQYKCAHPGAVDDDFQYAWVHSPKEAAIFDLLHEVGWRGENTGQDLGAGFTFSVSDDPDSENTGAVRFWFYCHEPPKDVKKDAPNESPKKPGFNLCLQIPPAFCVGMLHHHETHAALSDGVLSVTDDRGGHFRIDAASGRLLSFDSDNTAVLAAKKKIKQAAENDAGPNKSAAVIESATDLAVGGNWKGDNDHDAKDDETPQKMEVHFVRGAYQAEVAKIHGQTKDFENARDPRRPWISLAMFACNDPLAKFYLKEHNINEHWAAIAARLLAFGVCDPIEKMVGGWRDSNQYDYWVPESPDWKPDFSGGSPLAYLQIVVPLLDETLPHGSWPWTIVQQAAFLGAGKPHYVSSELSRIAMSPETGPLCLLTLSRLMSSFDPGASRTFAADGLKQLTKAAFIRDCEPFLREDCQLGDCVRRIVAAYRFASDQEVQTLAGKLDEQSAKYLAVCDRVLRRDPSKDFDNAMPELLGELWDAGVKEQVEQALARLRDAK
jgi:hypothetical protein